MNSNCDNSCNLALCLLGLLIIILTLRYYYMNKPVSESFSSPTLPHQAPEVYHPCSPDNFKKSMYEFYKSANNYRKLENELKEAQISYEKKYESFMKQHQNLSYHKDRISQCVNDVD